MRAFLEVLAVLLILAQIELAQDTTTCESHKDGDVNITVCTSGEYKSVMSCNHDGSSCTSTARRLKDAEDSDENLRKFCTAGLDGDCDNLAVRVERRKKVGSICDEDYVRTHEPEKCKKEADELKLNEEIVSKWLEREESKRTAKTLELCDKGVFDKVYCETFKKKMLTKAQDSKAQK